ncbi:MAG: hypothetical protein HC877_23820 [Thioploca sp.]|nr:hypothetical protein [Thioploca sp.]
MIDFKFADHLDQMYMEDEYEKNMNKVNAPKFKFALMPGLDETFLPKQASDNDTGYDVCCAAEDGILFKPNQKFLIPLGFRVFAPPGWWLELRPRSSTFAKKGLHCLYGVIDEGYENQLFLAAQFIPDDSLYNNVYYLNRIYGSDGTGLSLKIEFKERIAQLIPVKRQYMNVEQITDDEFDKLCKIRNGKRGTGGFGSSDKEC